MPAAPSGPGFYIESCFLPRVFSSVLFHLCFALSDVERGQPVAAADSGLSFSSSSSPCPGALIFSSFNLLAGLVYGDCAVRFLSSEKGRNKKTTFVLVQTQQETNSLFSTFYTLAFISNI